MLPTTKLRSSSLSARLALASLGIGGRIVVENRPLGESRGAAFEVQLPVVR